MLVIMTPEIQKNLEDRIAFEILHKLKTMFQQQAEQELFETVKAFHACKQEEGQSISTYVLKMKTYMDQMEGYLKLNKGALDLYVGNGNSAAVEAMGSFELILLTGMILHCHLGHINKKCIANLQHDGLLESIDDKSFDICVSCISGKMARKHFTHVSKRADDLLGIIHSDVCGPFKTMFRGGANYYVTFTDNFSRYGYVYLKYKHEVFEMFKTFQNEVENQLKKTIKALRSDRGGEYLSQEFLDHLRSCGIISQLTPPYTPQHNGEMVWGCEALVKRDTPNKLESGSIKCISVGYPKETMGYYFYYPLENKICVAREDAQPSENTSQHQHEVEHDAIDPQTDVIPIRRSAKIP
ncbi:retrotransposon protein, putative, ty1-copia subclass [Tanacetum coccineum]|uniref:Retrotransposon protein, putative, ty1-copia subclass n=1 Tax=Tanacetum coccineum TaxID=301880 RepID=A0ABQ5A0Y8_9ASTR